MGVLATIRSALARTIAPATAVPVRGTRRLAAVVREPFTGAWQQNDEISDGHGPVVLGRVRVRRR